MKLDLDLFTQKILEDEFSLGWPGHLIGKERIFSATGDELRTSLSPIDERPLMNVHSNKKYFSMALDKAELVHGQLFETKLEERIECLGQFGQGLKKYSQVIEKLYWIECGKPQWEAQHDLKTVQNYIEWIQENYIKIIKSLLAPAKVQPFEGEYYYQPIGTAFGFIPFSTPLTTLVNYLSSSLLTGCPLVLCSSSHTAVLTSVLSGILEGLNLPEGALSFFTGGFNNVKPAIRDKRIKALLYVGSNEHCTELKKESAPYAGRQLILQSGGKNSLLLHDTGDVDKAVDCTIFGALKSTGQMCTSTSRVFVCEKYKNEFVEKLVRSVEKISLKEPIAPDSNHFMGPLMTKKSVARFLQFQTMAARESETLVKGAKIGRKGNYVNPAVHLMNEFNPSSAYQSNVLFCPDIAVYGYETLSGAIESLSHTKSTFAVSFMGDVEIANSHAHEFNVANIIVNAPTCEQGTALALSGRMKSGAHHFSGIGIALRLLYPQIVQNNTAYPYEKWPTHYWKNS